MINNYMRHTLQHQLSGKYTKQIMKYICRLTGAIYKSPIKKHINVYRGVKKKHIDDAITAWENGDIWELHDWAFESFSQNIKKAQKYAFDKDPICPIVLQLKLEQGDYALYVDDNEFERILPPEQTYLITNCNNFKYYDKETKTKCKGKIYTIVKIT